MTKEYNKRVMIRVDSSSYIGAGHVVRCVTLAKALRNLKYLVDFYCINYAGSLSNIINSESFTVYDLPDVGMEFQSDKLPANKMVQVLDANNCKFFINKIKYDLVFVDSYRLDKIWEKEVCGLYKELVVIDDLANRDHECSYLIDQSLERMSCDYADLVNKETELFLGVEFSILRREFNLYKSRSEKKRSETKIIKRILICFGGGDSKKLTIKSIDVLLKRGFTGIIHIVVSSSNLWVSDLVIMFKQNRNIIIDVDLSSMWLAMFDADLSIGAFGSMAWERCCLGLPSISICIAENQQHIANALVSKGAIVLAKIDEISEGLNVLCPEYMTSRKWHETSENAFKLCDGLGVKRIIEGLKLN